MSIRIFKYFLVCLLLGQSVELNAQQTNTYVGSLSTYAQALELYEKEQYAAAQNAFEQVLKQVDDPNAEEYVNAVYFKALCALKLFNRDAEYQLTMFIQNYPESPRVKNAHFQLGKQYFRKRKWDKVTMHLGEIDIRDLSQTEQWEYYFRAGYAYFQLDDFEEAKKLFYPIIDIETPYYGPANYYYGHIAYESGNYETALKRFQNLENHPKFAVVTPYYISQIYFRQRKYDDVVEFATPLLENPKLKRKAEVSRLIGESHYALEQYSEALPFLEEYQKEGAKKRREDFYQLGHAYYMSKQNEKAVEWLQKVNFEDDELAQTATYEMAGAFLKLDDKRAARAAYERTYQLGFDEQMNEDAMFNFAKLSYELAYDPYNLAVDAFIDYLEKYPNSIRREEAYDYLVNIYVSIKNYQSAIASLERLDNREGRLESVYQQLVYNLGIEQFQNQQYDMAIESLEKSAEINYNTTLSTRAKFWIAESYYRQRKYTKSIEQYNEFLLSPGAVLITEFHHAQYAIGYAYFKTKQYEEGASWFRKYVNYRGNMDEARKSDAYIRTGDCYFISKKYYLSLEYYQKAIDLGLSNTDYAIYQYAMAQFVMKNAEEQVELLTKLVTDYPESDYLDAAKYQLGRSAVTSGESQKAADYFADVIENYPYSTYKRKSMISLGGIQYNQGKNEDALAVLQQVVTEYPNYSDSKDALRIIESIYKETGRISDYEAYVEGLDFLNLSEATLDSLRYESAELQYQSGDCQRSAEGFKEYLERFEQPIFGVNANFYRAECMYREGKFEEAIVGYDYVLERGLNKFTEYAVVRAAEIRFKEKNYDEALKHYQRMEQVSEIQENKRLSIIGQMRCFYRTEQWMQALEYGEKTLKMENIHESVRVQSEFVVAKSKAELGEFEEALTLYDALARSTQSEYSAKSRYNIAEILVQQERFDTAEVAIFELVNQTPTYEYWLAKGLILLADVYLVNEDSFQAKATLESILANFRGDQDLLDEAQEKLDEIIASEESPETDAPPMEIDFSDDYQQLDRLFDEEEEELLIDEE